MQAKAKTEADIKHYSDMKHADYQRELLTDKYVQMRAAESMYHNLKVFYGEKLPSNTLGFPGINTQFNATVQSNL